MIDTTSFRVSSRIRCISSASSEGSGLDSSLSFHLPPSAPTSGVSSWCSRDPDGITPPSGFSDRVRDRNPDSRAAGTPAPPSWNGSSLVPPARRTPVTWANEESVRRRRGQTPLTRRRVRVCIAGSLGFSVISSPTPLSLETDPACYRNRRAPCPLALCVPRQIFPIFGNEVFEYSVFISMLLSGSFALS